MRICDIICNRESGEDMEIIAEGKGSKYFTPNEIIFNLTFVVKGNTYEEVLEKGSKSVEVFINEVLIKNEFTKEDLKTRSFVIREETKYNNETKNREFDGYSYNQHATLSFDYNKDLLGTLMEDISKLENPPTYQITFGLKDERKARREVLELAYNDALEKAYAIAHAAGKTLKRCLKVDSKPFDTVYISESNLDYSLLNQAKTISNVADIIITSFTPEDIEITERLYCLWIAE